MKIKKSLIATLPDNYKKRIGELSDESLKIILKDRKKAIEYAKRGIEQTEPKKANDEYITLVADSMQILAKIVLEERELSTNR